MSNQQIKSVPRLASIPDSMPRRQPVCSTCSSDRSSASYADSTAAAGGEASAGAEAPPSAAASSRNCWSAAPAARCRAALLMSCADMRAGLTRQIKGCQQFTWNKDLKVAVAYFSTLLPMLQRT